jgi:hypothetical protein
MSRQPICCVHLMCQSVYPDPPLIGAAEALAMSERERKSGCVR